MPVTPRGFTSAVPAVGSPVNSFLEAGKRGRLGGHGAATFKMGLFRVKSVCWLLAVVLIASSLLAQTAATGRPAISPTVTREAAELVNRGFDLLSTRDVRNAEGAFRKAIDSALS